MKKIGILPFDDSPGQFGEFPDRMLIRNNLYDLNTLELLSDNENSFNVTNNTNPHMYVGSKYDNDNRNVSLGGGNIAIEFKGRGSNRSNTTEIFSYNCFWQEPNNNPIYEWSNEEFYYVFLNTSSTAFDAGIKKYSKNATKYYNQMSGNNWGSQSWAIQSDIDKGRYILGAPYYNDDTYIYDFAIDKFSFYRTYYDNWDTHAYGAGNIVVNNDDHVIDLRSMINRYDQIKIKKYVKDTHNYTSYNYNHPINTDNTSGAIPVKQRSDGKVVNVANNDMRCISYVSKGIEKSSGIVQHFLCYYINPYNNDQAPFVATYIDDNGVEQERNMRYGIISNSNYCSQFFGLYKTTIDHNNEEYYHDIIDIDWSAYPDANMWDETDTESRKESYAKNVHFDKYSSYAIIHTNCEIFTVDNVDYLIVFSASIGQNGNNRVKLVSMVFTYDIENNSATLIDKPYIVFQYDELHSLNFYIKKMDDSNQDWMITYENSNYNEIQQIYRLKWDPVNYYVETNISDYWNHKGLYIDKLNRVWGLDINGILRVGNIDSELKYDISLQEESKIKWDGVNDIIKTVNIYVQDLLGNIQKSTDINVKIVSETNNVKFNDDTIESTITTDDNGLASIDIKITSDGDFEIIVDKIQGN